MRVDGHRVAYGRCGVVALATRVSPASLVLVMYILRGSTCEQKLLFIGVLNIGIDQFALFVQIFGLFLERRLNAAAAQALADKTGATARRGANCSRSGRSRGGAQTELFQEGVGRAVNDGLTALGGHGPSSRTRPLSTSDAMTPSELTPRMPLTTSRVYGLAVCDDGQGFERAWDSFCVSQLNT